MTSALKALFWFGILATTQVSAEVSEKKLSAQELLINAAFGASIATITILCVPYILSVGTVFSVKAAVGVGVSKATIAASTKSIFASAVPIIKVATPIASHINSSITGIYLIKRCFFPSTEQKIQQLLMEKARAPFEKELKEVVEKSKK